MRRFITSSWLDGNRPRRRGRMIASNSLQPDRYAVGTRTLRLHLNLRVAAAWHLAGLQLQLYKYQRNRERVILSVYIVCTCTYVVMNVCTYVLTCKYMRESAPDQDAHKDVAAWRSIPKLSFFRFSRLKENNLLPLNQVPICGIHVLSRLCQFWNQLQGKLAHKRPYLTSVGNLRLPLQELQLGNLQARNI